VHAWTLFFYLGQQEHAFSLDHLPLWPHCMVPKWVRFAGCNLDLAM